MAGRRLLYIGLTAAALASGSLITSTMLASQPAYGATATGCSGQATSADRHGDDIGHASAPGRGATESDPLKIDSAGTVAYQGHTDKVIRSGSWKVDIYGLDSFSGTITNGSGETNTSGVAHMKKYLHLSFGPINTTITGKYHVTVSATGENGATCSVDAWIHIVDSPVRTPFFYAAILLLLFALFLFLIWGRPEALLDVLAGDYDKAAEKIGAEFFPSERP